MLKCALSLIVAYAWPFGAPCRAAGTVHCPCAPLLHIRPGARSARARDPVLCLRGLAKGRRSKMLVDAMPHSKRAGFWQPFARAPRAVAIEIGHPAQLVSRRARLGGSWSRAGVPRALGPRRREAVFSHLRLEQRPMVVLGPSRGWNAGGGDGGLTRRRAHGSPQTPCRREPVADSCRGAVGFPERMALALRKQRLVSIPYGLPRKRPVTNVGAVVGVLPADLFHNRISSALGLANARAERGDTQHATAIGYHLAIL